jgi:hypothetical protein
MPAVAVRESTKEELRAQEVQAVAELAEPVVPIVLEWRAQLIQAAVAAARRSKAQELPVVREDRVSSS